MTHALFLWLLVSPQPPSLTCDGPNLVITQKKRVVFELRRWLQAAPTAGLRVTIAKDLLRVRNGNVLVASLRLPAAPSKTLRKKNLVILALGTHGILFLDVRDPVRPQPVMQRLLARPVDGFELHGGELVPTSGGHPIEEVVTRVVTCDDRDAEDPPNTPAAPLPPSMPLPPPVPAGPLPETPPEILLDRTTRAPAAPPLEAGATELALFTTARTLPRGATLVELAALGIPGYLPEASLDVWGLKWGLSERAQLGFRTSFRLITELGTDAEGLLGICLMGLNFKYQLWRDEETSLSINYVFPYTELIWSHRSKRSSFTFAAGTSLITWIGMIAHHGQPYDFFVRTGVVMRLSKAMSFIVEAGLYRMPDEFTDAFMFTTVGLRIGGGRAYLDAFVGAGGVPGSGALFAGLALGWQP